MSGSEKSSGRPILQMMLPEGTPQWGAQWKQAIKDHYLYTVKVLTGGSMPSTHNAPSAFTMPDFGWRLNDAQVADVLSFVRGSWGNHAAAVSSSKVGSVRKSLAAIQKTEH
jgi:mono/diheme cytochrome c family protein